MESPQNKDDFDDILLDVNKDINNQNFVKDFKIIKLQENLLMMGFDINMINKVIMYFNIKTEIVKSLKLITLYYALN